MGREVRRVPSDWRHPVTENGKYDPVTNAQMPHWQIGEATHYQMYENTTEGTPISPPMATPERLAHWLVENEVNAGLGQTASYEAWLKVCKGEPSFSFARTGGKWVNGVEAGYQSDLSHQREARTSELDCQRTNFHQPNEQSLEQSQERSWEPEQ